MNFLYVASGVAAYFICGTFFLGILIGMRQIEKKDEGRPFVVIFWPIVLLVSLGIVLYGSVYRFAVWIGSPGKAKPKASPSTPSVIDLSSVPALPDPETMPDEFKGKK